MSNHSLLTGCLLAAYLLALNLDATAQQRRFAEGKPFMFSPRQAPTPPPGGTRPTYRTYDGTNNNLAPGRAEWGASEVPLLRELPTEYDPTDPRNALGGVNRPSARKVSNVLCDEPETIFNARNLSTYIYVWGQFLDHDIALTPTGNTEAASVPLPADEPLFTVPVPFFRSEIHAGTGITNPRQQTNLSTAWIDGSMIYGSDETRARWLRTLQRGKLKTSTGNMLPWNTTTGEQADPIDPNAPSMGNDQDHTAKTFVAGDVRAVEHPGITALHVVFLREHNRICDRLRAQGLTNDEEIYQKARKEVGALVQAITYNEFLPAMGVSLNNYSGYRNNVQPDLLNSFATASYRIGHTMVADEILLRDNNCQKVGTGTMELDEAFFDPQIVITYGVDPFLRGFAAHKSYETNTKINPILRDLLFGDKHAAVRFGLDLASLNIQRGRDHGLPDYNAARAFYLGRPVNNFSQITSNTAVSGGLRSLYGNVNEIDLWVGLLAEDLLPGKSVGPTMHAMLKVQFERLRDGDFYYFRNDPALANNLRDQMGNARLSEVIRRNTSITTLQSNVFITVPCPGENGEGARVATVGEVDEMTVNVSPNPVQNVLNVELDGRAENRLLRVVDLNGKVLQQTEAAPGQTQVTLPVEKLRSGMLYLLKVSGEKQMKSVRFLKN